jgi:VanZ family protein
MRWWLAAGFYMAGLFALSSVPDDGGGPGAAVLFPPPALQNLLHVPVYAGLAWLLWRALRGRALLAAAIAIAYGALDEVHQMFVQGRTASVTDALLNALGAAAVAAWVTLRARAREE